MLSPTVSRGCCALSIRTTSYPFFARIVATEVPAGPPPTTSTSVRTGNVIVVISDNLVSSGCRSARAPRGSHEPRHHGGNRTRSLEVLRHKFLDWHHEPELVR